MNRHIVCLALSLAFLQIYGYTGWDDSEENKESGGTKRVSEKKCEEYSSSVYTVIQSIALDLNYHVHSLTTSKCDYESTELIVGGVDAKLGEFPHMAAIGWETGEGISFSCGGTLISPRFVLTAAHCSKARGTPNPYPSVVRLGEHNINPEKYDGASPVDVKIFKIHVYPTYSRKLQYDDIALFELDKNVQLSNSIRPACLWTSESFGHATNALATGWGITNSSTLATAEILQKVSLNLFQNADCNVSLSSSFNKKWYGFSDRQICAGKEGEQKDTCQGDSGSPLQITLKKNQCVFYVIGVTAKGKSFCGYGPAVYTRVSSFLDWIEGIVWPEG